MVGGRTLPFIGKGHPDFIWKKHPLFGKKENPSLEDYITQSVQAALKDTNTPASAIEKVPLAPTSLHLSFYDSRELDVVVGAQAWIGNFAGELFSSQGHLGTLAPAVVCRSTW